ncbi:MAG TPA: PEGA domain-containing protein [Pyrinomonadaceae bacterium]|nr:PEGA domain-containing protein [Pyrinomonadaceae bacterium]
MNPRFKTSAALLGSKALLAACALVMLAGLGSAPAANAQDRNSRAGRFEISTTPGGYPVFIDGQPRGTTSTTVQLYDVEPGAHTVEIRFPNNTTWRRDFTIAPNKRQCIVLNFRPKTVTIERAVKSPCPYPVNISAPSSVREGDQVTFSADVGYAGQSGLNYTWTISPPTARIAQGAGTPTITVDTTGVGNQRVTAILVVDDGSGDRNCRQRAQFATAVTALPQVPRPTGRQFAEFPSVAFNEDKANFDNFAVALQEDPTATGYIIVYNGRRSRPARLNTLVNRSREYVVNTRNIDRSRVVVMGGGTREVDTIELWIVPQGATPPRPTPR